MSDRGTAARRTLDLAHALRRYEALVRAVSPIVWVTDADGQVAEPSEGWERATGQSYDQFRDYGWLDAVHPDDRDAAARAWSAAVGTRSVYTTTYRLRMTDGTYRAFEARGVPVWRDGAIAEWMGTCTDVEEQVRRARRDEMVARVTAATARSPGLDSALAAIASVLVPSVADGCGVYLLRDADDAVDVRMLTYAYRDDLRPGPSPFHVPEALAERIVARADLAVPSAVPISDDLTAVLPRTDALSWLLGHGVRCLHLQPVLVDGAAVAVLMMFTVPGRDELSAADVELVHTAVNAVSSPLSRVWHASRTERIAVAMQRSQLTEPPTVPGLEIVARYRPTRAVAEVGGDWYDAFTLPDGSVALTIGDVAGHDLPAAVAMGQLRTTLRVLAVDRHDEEPGDIVRRLSGLIGPVMATCVLGRLTLADDGWLLTYSVAGHPPPIVVDKDGSITLLDDARNPLLGIFPGQARTSAATTLAPGSTLLLYTDGLVERRDEVIDDGIARAAATVAALRGRSLRTLCDALVADPAVAGDDDIAVIAVRFA